MPNLMQQGWKEIYGVGRSVSIQPVIKEPAWQTAWLAHVAVELGNHVFSCGEVTASKLVGKCLWVPGVSFNRAIEIGVHGSRIRASEHGTRCVTGQRQPACPHPNLDWTGEY